MPCWCFQRPGTNALEASETIQATVGKLAKDLPAGIEFRMTYNPTEFFVRTSIEALEQTIYEAIALVVLVVIVFLQNWPRHHHSAARDPRVAGRHVRGHERRSATPSTRLTLFGLVLAVGIVVDDAIVVVENVERYLREGLSAKEAARRTMDEVGGALISIALVLTSVFVPTMFLEGISGEFFRQFAVVISVATLISAFNSLSLSPALAGLLLKGHDAHAVRKPSFLARLLQPLIDGFNSFFDALSRGYASLVRWVIRLRVLMLIVYAGLIAAAVWMFILVPRGFVPSADQGYVIALVQLPSGSSLQRTDEIVREVGARSKAIPGVNFVHMFPGRNLATGTQSSSAGVVFVQFEEFEKRKDPAKSANAIQAEINKRVADISGAQITVIAPPTIRGIGASGGFSLRVQDMNNRGPIALEQATQDLLKGLMADPRIMFAFSPFNSNAPEFFVDVDRTKAEMLGVPVQRVHDTLEGYLGSAYVNDFNLSGRTYQVIAQAEGLEPSRRRADRPPEGQERDGRHGAVGLGCLLPHEGRPGPRAPLQPVPDSGDHRREPSRR